jgi:hypothetical protein
MPGQALKRRPEKMRSPSRQPATSEGRRRPEPRVTVTTPGRGLRSPARAWALLSPAPPRDPARALRFGSLDQAPLRAHPRNR